MTPALLLLLAQAAKPFEMPVGTNAEFQSLVASVVADAHAGKWEAARAKAELLPQTTLAIDYDDQSVPAELRKEYRQGFDDAIAAWKQGMPELAITLSKGGGLKLSYAPELAANPETGLPRGAAPFWSVSGAQRLEYVIGLQRSKPLTPINQNHVMQETVFAIGSWLGLAQVPVPGKALARTDTLSQFIPPIDRSVTAPARQLIEFSDRIRAAVKARTPIQMAVPRAVLGLNQFNGEPIDEGKFYRFSIPISNNGDGDLRVTMVPDCSCFQFEGPDRIAPGQTGIFKVASDTRGFIGPQQKALYFYTNDPEEPVRMFRVSEFVRPRFRVVDGQRGKPVAADAQGARATVYVYAPSGTPFKIVESAVSGVAGVVSVKPLNEPIADALMGEGPKARIGYRIDVLMSPADVTGRVPVSINLKTDDPSIPYLTHQLILQKGIASDPEELYFGTGPRKTRTRTAVLESAGEPFKVLGVEGSDPAVSATYTQVTPDQVQVTVVLKDTVDFGDFTGEVRVKTDSPSQPIVRIRLRARVQ